jgi:serine phosphatase RsbU (regulator of sigma subunit)
MGLAGRFTLGLGMMVGLIALVAGYLLWRGAEGVTNDATEQARRGMASETAEMLRDQVQIEGIVNGRQVPGPDGVSIQTGRAKIDSESGAHESRIYQIEISRGGETAEKHFLYAPTTAVSQTGDRMLILILLVVGGLVLGTVAFGALAARRIAAPLRSIVDDVLAISRGRLDRRIHAEGAVKEVTFLARAVDRMVHSLVEGQETQQALEESQLEVDSLQELRRNLKPLTSEAPFGYRIETSQLDAVGEASGDFVDSMADAHQRNTLVVGSTGTRGMSGALLMAMTRAYLRGPVLHGASPAEACVETNAALNRDLARGLFASAIVLRLDPEKSVVDLVSAGHKAPAVRWDAAAGELRKLQPNGIALGFDEGPIFAKSLEVVEVPLKPGDAIFMFSPGLFLCTNAAGKALGEAGVYSLAKIAIQSGLDVMAEKLSHYLGEQDHGDLAFALLSNTMVE